MRQDPDDQAADPGYRGPGTYLHMKGARYRVHGLGRHEATGEEFVVYEALDQGSEGPRFWLRPRTDFDAVIGEVARFVLLAPA